MGVVGSDKERGLLKWREEVARKYETEEDEEGLGMRKDPLALYEIPCLTYKLRKWSWTKYVPFLPTFVEKKKNKKRRRRRQKIEDEDVV